MKSNKTNIATTKNGIYACIASIPTRKQSLIKTINSILPQVDKVYLYLNDYSKESARRIKGIAKDKIVYVIRDNSLYGDAGKFYWADKLKGYVFTCDDDLIYPPNYVKTVIEGIEKYHRLAIVSFHGRILRTPIQSSSYSTSYIRFIAFNEKLDSDVFVHTAGSGVMGFHTDTIKPTMKDFPSANMADIYLSVLAQKKKVPLVILSHKSNWIQEIYSNNSISKSKSGDYLEREKRVKEIEWKLYRVEFKMEYNNTPPYGMVNKKNRNTKLSTNKEFKIIFPKKCTIIIPHHNRHDHLKNLLDRLDNKLFDIVIVSGGSFSENCNKGAEMAKTDKLIFINDDALPTNENILEICNTLNDYDVVGSTQIIRGVKYYGIGLFHYFNENYIPKIKSESNKSLFPSGFLFGVKNKKWKALGGFNTGFRTGHEDVDFGIRCLKSNLSISILDLEIYHEEAQSEGRFKYTEENLDLFNKIYSQKYLKSLHDNAHYCI